VSLFDAFFLPYLNDSIIFLDCLPLLSRSIPLLEELLSEFFMFFYWNALLFELVPPQLFDDF